ncbi:hypothetical protein [Hyunsoonleella ulvae]|uniref:hypothetical protein n=1 Tax=Hyunsoonleella ulvae TaxID=2799948 RepID=UPI001939E529|nr:hypothetical protein [Hyunsoonleella ulvae]
MTSILSICETHAQVEPNFNYQVLTRVGHLSKDKELDSIVVKQDTVNEFKPYKLEIYINKKKSRKALVVSTDKAIAPEHFRGVDGLDGKKSFSDIRIKNRIFTIVHNYENQVQEHSFSLEGSRFKLIKYYSIKLEEKGKIIYETINFNTLIRRTKTINSSDNQVLDREYKLSTGSKYLKDLNMVPETYQ